MNAAWLAAVVMAVPQLIVVCPAVSLGSNQVIAAAVVLGLLLAQVHDGPLPA